MVCFFRQATDKHLFYMGFCKQAFLATPRRNIRIMAIATDVFPNLVNDEHIYIIEFEFCHPDSCQYQKLCILFHDMFFFHDFNLTNIIVGILHDSYAEGNGGLFHEHITDLGNFLAKGRHAFHVQHGGAFMFRKADGHHLGHSAFMGSSKISVRLYFVENDDSI